ncbi:MAG: TolC family protein, partial [Deltaproteobacteria bacterium]|nr:TolC family protein [Deltaproteobacteria bacterium]
MKRFQKTSQIFTIALCLLCSPAAGLSDDTTPSETAAPLSITDNRISVPLESVLLLALKNNLDITFARLQPELSQTDIMREKGAYDTFFSSQFTKYRENKQVGSALMGSGAGSDLFQEQFNLDASLAKKFTSGTQAELKLSHKESENGMPFSGLVPEYYGELSMSLTQPLLRDFGIKIGSSMIRIASLNLEVSENELRRNVMDILYQVEAFYWDLLFRIEDLKSKQKSLKRAEDLEREFKIRIDAGTLAPIEIYQAKAEVALRTQEVIVAESQVASAEDNLKAALNLYEDEKYWNIIIVPTDMPDTTKINPNLTECIAIALEKRPDFKQAQLNIKASNIQVKYAKNQTMPRIDLIGTIGTNGLAGRPQ